MHEQATDRADRADQALDVIPWDEGRQAGFTRREWRRLVFLRWLYRTGRLTEWPADQA